MVINALKMLPEKSIILIVAEARALFTLADANALDTLLLPNGAVIIPDMVEFEVMHHTDQLGVQKIQDWIRSHAGRMVSIVQTEEYTNFKTLYGLDQNAKLRNRAELSAGEILSQLLEAGGDMVSILYEDSNVGRSKFLRPLPDNVFLTTTTDLLSRLKPQKN